MEKKKKRKTVLTTDILGFLGCFKSRYQNQLLCFSKNLECDLFLHTNEKMRHDQIYGFSFSGTGIFCHFISVLFFPPKVNVISKIKSD